MSNRGGPFPNLDAYRGIGMVMVMTNHAAYSAGLFNRHPTLNAFIARFDISIPVFFMVSGFLLFRPYVLSILGDRPRPASAGYFRNRALRLLPAYWAALAGVMIWYGLPRGRISSIPIYALMLQTFSAQTVFRDFGAFDQAWSIGTEVTFYLLLPVLAYLAHRAVQRRPVDERGRFLLLGCVALWALAQAWRILLVATQPPWIASATFWLPAHIDFFALGMGMAIFSARDRLHLTLPRPLVWLSLRPWACWLIALALWLIVVNPTHLIPLFEIRRDPLEFTAEYVAKQFMYCPVGFFYLLPAMFGPQHTGWIRRVLGSRFLSSLGVISLGFYLWHKAWLIQAGSWTGAKPFYGSFPKLWLITLAGGLLSGTLSYWLVERPFLRLKGRRTSTAAVAPAATAAAT